ncbi:MAG TPA: alpha/beta hydrolase [Stellaceae bacterium]|nr:alpha/beta hydrolase [Stellaceae bacterium]
MPIATVMPLGFQPGQHGMEKDRTLVVVLHGWRSSPERLRDVARAASTALDNPGGLDLFVPKMPQSRWYSFKSPTEITAALLRDLDRICQDPDRYSRIFLVGHSIGAVIARRLFLIAIGMNQVVASEGVLNGEPARPWAIRVQRIVTLAGLNRGWVRSGRLGWQESLATSLVALVGHGWVGTSAPTLFSFRRGAPFVVHTRLQWLALQRDAQAHKPLVVQLLGTQDDLVGPDDAVDFAVDGTGDGGYLYIELPETDHPAAVIFSPRPDDPNGARGDGRRRRFVAALTESHEALERMSVDRRFLADTLPLAAEPGVERVVFVIHGIRDDGYWTRRIGQRVREAAEAAGLSADSNRTITATYGYFAMLPFIWPWIRREKVEWLMDQYVAAVAQYPKAQFSYVGHSNGTYLLARALQDYPAAHFHNVLFAGSVVRRDYRWKRLIDQSRIRHLVNMVATADWVVAIFPSGLEPLRGFDVGGAGFGGFKEAAIAPTISEVRYVRGGHGAGIAERHWPGIAGYIVHGAIPASDPDAARQSRLLRAAARVSSLLLAGIVAVFGFLPFYFAYEHVGDGGAYWGAGMAGLAFAYFLLLRFVVTRV